MTAASNMTELHRFVPFDRAMDYVRMGWVPLPSPIGTHHGRWAVHLMWRCCCGRRARAKAYSARQLAKAAP